ncbi:hypothetical protein MD484_g5352, partial [Candolleomyces efflorescens]
MLYLSSLSNPLADASVFPEGLVPPRETNVEDPQLHRMSRVLDAMVYFLPVSKGQVFALSLEVGERVRIYVAGNDGDHFRPAFGHTPDAMIQSIWDALRSIASEPTNNSLRKDLVVSLFERHIHKMQNRFEKRKEQCQLFFELADDPALVSQRTPEKQEFLEVAHDIFYAMSSFFELPEGGRKEAHLNLYHHLDEVQTYYSKSKSAFSNTWRDLELKVRETLTRSPPFDLVRYIDKLVSPSVHAARLLKTARNKVFEKIIRLPLDVIVVPTHPGPLRSLDAPSAPDIQSFLVDCYGEYTSDEEPVVLEVLKIPRELGQSLPIYRSL